jgi:hypothetical protein
VYTPIRVEWPCDEQATARRVVRTFSEDQFGKSSTRVGSRMRSDWLVPPTLFFAINPKVLDSKNETFQYDMKTDLPLACVRNKTINSVSHEKYFEKRV